MGKKLIFRLWFSRLSKYLLIPMALCIILFPLYSILHQQTVKAQLSDASEQLAASVSVFEGYLYDIRFVTNKLFHDSTFNILAASRDDDILGDDTTAQAAPRMLEDLTYSLSPVAYSFVTFQRNHMVIDNSRLYRSYESFYPGTLEYEGLTLEQWAGSRYSQQMVCLPVQKICLYQTAYPDNYLSVTQPFFDSNSRYIGSCTMLLRERQLVNLFLPLEEWRSSGMFYIAREDGSLLQSYRYPESKALNGLGEDGSLSYNGQEYLFVSREIPDLNAVAVIGLPYAVYAENLQTINQAIWFYILAGLLVCLALSTAMTLGDMRYLRPMMDTLGHQEAFNTKKLESIVLQKLNAHNQLSVELARTRNQMEHGRMETLLKTGYLSSSADSRQLMERLKLTQNNYLLMIPAPQESQEIPGQELRLMLIAEQLYSCFGQQPFVHNATDGSVLAILTLEDGGEDAYRRLYCQTEALQRQLGTAQPLILSARFVRLEQLSSVYWQVRNAAASSDLGAQVRSLSDQLWERAAVPEITTLERLNEYLLAGHTEEAQALVLQMFGSDDLTPQNFQQIFYSIRGVLLNAAQKTGCEDISFLCGYDRRRPMQKQVRDLCECCLMIGSHVDALKQSHNLQLQQSLLRWLEENFSCQNLNAAMAAETFGISKKYVSQFLKDQTGRSFNEYVEELRLTHAMTLLRTTELSITEIAANCGFSTQNTFYKAFRRRYDLSPSAVRHPKVPQ